MANTQELGLSALEYHVLLALASGPLHGYAVKEAVVTESTGALTPRAGSLYRVLARLLTAGLVTESASNDADEPHPGLARRYYALSRRGRATLATEAHRLRGAALLAEKRLGIARSRS